MVRSLGTGPNFRASTSRALPKDRPPPEYLTLSHLPEPIAVNRGPEVLDGFRGDVHPLLFGRTRLEVTAQWTRIGKGRMDLERLVGPLLYSWFTDLHPAQPRRTYTERDFSAFLPDVVGPVGQLWSIDGEKVAEILKQFHRHPSMHLIAPGRRAGPDGAFAILRAVSPSYLDILFRVHAEFYLTPDNLSPELPPVGTWYTPAYFWGRVLVNRQTGTIDHFRLALPTDKPLNVHLTVNRLFAAFIPRDIVRVERMELTSGDAGPANHIAWTNALTPAEALGRLAKVFYRHLQIDWVPFDQVLAQARSRGLPIFALVSWGATDDETC
jgi:hypothetical protein